MPGVGRRTPYSEPVLTADDVLAVVRVHADRLHDAVRRMGCSPPAAVHVVETASLELVDAVYRGRSDAEEPVGWLFARARVLGRHAAGGDDTVPVGGGVLGGDGNQVRLAEALDSRPERERTPLLLRDSYDLPMSSVATALGLDLTAATETLGAARLNLLPGLTGTPAPRIPDHVPLSSLTRLAEGGQQAARETSARRHAESCDRCATVVDAQERVRRLLTGLTVVALPDAEREQLLAVVEARARALLPAAVPVTDEWEEEEPHRRYSLSLMALGVVLALAAGIGLGVLTSRGNSGPKTAAATAPLVTAAPVISVGPAQTVPPPIAPVSPSPRVFFITPSPTPPPTQEPSPTPSATEPVQEPVLQLDPTSGPADSPITVTGSGWKPFTRVTVQYMNASGLSAGDTNTAVTDAAGTFTTTIQAHDSTLGNPNPTGPHTVRASDGTQQTTATFEAT